MALVNVPSLDGSVLGQVLPLSVSGALPLNALVVEIDTAGTPGPPGPPGTPVSLLIDVQLPAYAPLTSGFTGVYGRIGLGLVASDYIDADGFLGGTAVAGAKDIAIDMTSVMPPGFNFYNQGDGFGSLFEFDGLGAVSRTSAVRCAFQNDGIVGGSINVLRVSFFDPTVRALVSGEIFVQFRSLGRIGPA